MIKGGIMHRTGKCRHIAMRDKQPCLALNYCLAGPAVIDRGSALTEALVFIPVAATWAFRVGARVKTSWWLRLLQGSQG